MTDRSRPRRIFDVAMACAVLMAGFAACPAAEDKPKPLTLEQRKRLLDLVGQLRRLGTADTVWLAGATELAALGEVGMRRVRPMVRAKLTVVLKNYEDTFLVEAKRVRIERLAAAAKADGKSHSQFSDELEGLRRTVLDLKGDAALSKDKIVSEADPAMRRLDELLTVKPAAVLAASEKLRAHREGVIGVWDLRDRLEARQGPKAGEALTRFEGLAVFLAMPISSDDRRVLLDNARAESKLKPTEVDGIRDLNRIRLLLGLRALKIDVKLCEAARDHSKDMREKRFFSHTSPVPGKKSFGDRARRAGTSAHAENIAGGAQSGAGVNRMWFHSPGHMKNMLGGHRRVGLGHDGRWTQMFGG